MTDRRIDENVEISLDPADWDGMKALGHRMVDEMMEYLRDVRERPAWKPVATSAKEALSRPMPKAPEGAERAYRDFVEHVLPYPEGNIHPRFWAWVIGTGTPLGALSEMLAATMNPNCGSGDHAAIHVEHQVLSWLKEMIGWPATGSGLLVSGGSMANLVGIAAGRHARSGYDVRRRGAAGGGRPLVLYGSTETHSCVQKAVELLGIGSDFYRRIPVDAEYRIDVRALSERIAVDRREGMHPFCVVGNAGTVNTGATDDLTALADLCAEEGLWLHVDGAFGALAALSPSLRPIVAGMERADSVAFDLHKWMYMPYETGCVLVRDAAAHRDAFSMTPPYLSRMSGGIASEADRFSEYGPQLSRGFRALKVWMSLKEHGVDRYARLIEQNVAQARHLGRLVEASDDLELMAPVPLNVVCFRFTAAGLDGDALDAINREILVRLQEEGTAVPSHTVLGGRFAIRAAITNHRSRRADFDLLAEETVRLGRSILQERASA